MSQIYDFNDNSDKIYKLFKIVGEGNIPDFIKNANLKTDAELSKQAYADQGRYKFEINTPANTYFSAGYFLLNAEEGNRPKTDIYLNIKEAARAYDSQSESGGLLDAIKKMEDVFLKRAEEKIGATCDYQIVDSDDNVVFNIKNKNDVLAASEAVSNHYQKMSDWDKFLVFGQIKQAANIIKVDLPNLSLWGEDKVDINSMFEDINLDRLSNFMLKASSYFTDWDPSAAKVFSKFAKYVYDNSENIAPGKFAEIFKVAAELNKKIGWGEDIFKCAFDKSEEKETGKYSIISVDGKSFGEDDINNVPEDVLNAVFGDAFYDKIADVDKKIDMSKFSTAVTSMDETDKVLLRRLIEKYSGMQNILEQKPKVEEPGEESKDEEEEGLGDEDENENEEEE